MGGASLAFDRSEICAGCGGRPGHCRWPAPPPSESYICVGQFLVRHESCRCRHSDPGTRCHRMGWPQGARGEPAETPQAGIRFACRCPGSGAPGQGPTRRGRGLALYDLDAPFNMKQIGYGNGSAS